jgi:integral membrane protein
VLTQILHRYEKSKLFSEIEAWNLFRLAALSEAVGWSLLIIGVIINHYNLPGHSISIIIAGQIHGTIFLIYFAVLLAVYGSTGWSRKKSLLPHWPEYHRMELLCLSSGHLIIASTNWQKPIYLICYWFC